MERLSKMVTLGIDMSKKIVIENNLEIIVEILYFILIYALFCSTASMMYQYFVKIVPTIYVKGDGEVRELSYMGNKNV